MPISYRVMSIDYKTAIKNFWFVNKNHQKGKIRKYGYILSQKVCVDTKIKTGKKFIIKVAGKKILSLSKTGFLEIEPNYTWDGTSGCVKDTSANMFASLVHDALYQLMREESKIAQTMGTMSRYVFRLEADNLFHDHWVQNKGLKLWVKFCYGVLREYGESSTYPFPLPPFKFIKLQTGRTAPDAGSIPCPKGKGGVKKKTTPKRKKALKSQKKSRGS